jgi:hypothetical protein
LLLKTSSLIDELALYDVVNTPGVAADLSHISSPAVSFLYELVKLVKSLKLTMYYNRKSPATCRRTRVPRRLSRMRTSSSSPLESPV